MIDSADNMNSTPSLLSKELKKSSWQDKRATGTGNAQHIGRVLTHRKASLGAAKLKHRGQTGVSQGSSTCRSPHCSECLRARVAHVNAKPQLPAFRAEDPVLIPGLGRSPGEGNGNPLQYSCLENSVGRGAWWTTTHGVRKSWDTTERLTLCFTFTFPDT